MNLPKGFKVNGTPASNGVASGVAKKLVTMLEKLPDDELMTYLSLAGVFHMSFSSFRNHMMEPCLIEYRHKVGNKVYWGNKRTIKKLRQQTEA